MAWTEPYTEWTSNDRVLPEDMNRIAGNLNYLYPAGALKDSYVANDFVTAAEWAEILDVVTTLSYFTGVTLAAMPNSDTTADNFNAVESITLAFEERLEFMALQNKAQGYAADPIYASDIPDQYVRGI